MRFAFYPWDRRSSWTSSFGTVSIAYGFAYRPRIDPVNGRLEQGLEGLDCIGNRRRVRQTQFPDLDLPS